MLVGQKLKKYCKFENNILRGTVNLTFSIRYRLEFNKKSTKFFKRILPKEATTTLKVISHRRPKVNLLLTNLYKQELVCVNCPATKKGIFFPIPRSYITKEENGKGRISQGPQSEEILFMSSKRAS